MAHTQSTLRSPSFIQRLLDHFASLKAHGRRNRLVTSTIFSLLLIALLTEGRRRRNLSRSKEQGRRRGIVRRNSGVLRKDGSRVIYVPTSHAGSKERAGTMAEQEKEGKEHLARVVIYPTKLTTFLSHRRLFLSPTNTGGKSGDQTPTAKHPPTPPADVKPGLNLAFLHQFTALWSIMVPRIRSKETLLLSLHAFFLIARTYLSLVVARLDGEIVRDLVAGNGRAFLLGLLKWIAVGVPGVYCNAMIKYLQSKLSISFRTRLTRYIHDLYLNDELPYYKLTNLDGGLTRGGGADQYITSDLTLFCDSAAALYSSLGKPSLDLIVFNYQLARSLGLLALGGIMGNYVATAYLLRSLAPNFARLAERVGRGEGTVRAGHTRLIANSEEIAFYGGSEMERSLLDKSFRELKTLLEGIYSLKIRYNMLEDFVLKYSWSAFGYIISSVPIFIPAWGGLGGLVELSTADLKNAMAGDTLTQSRTGAFVTNKRLMLSLADAGGRMMYSFKDLSELAGYTSRVYSLISTLHRVHSNSYSAGTSSISGEFSLSDVQGTLHKGFDGVRLENVPLVAPATYPLGGELLIEKHLNFVVREGEHLLISGPNGVGKSSVNRIVAGLWPTYRGLVSRPRKIGGIINRTGGPNVGEGGTGFGEGIMFIPQRVYLSIGTLRDQVIYPHTEMDMRECGRSDAELAVVLEKVRLGYLVGREGGWDCRKEWKDVLSGGEKQRVGIARLIYHQPKYAFIDEGTSAVSSDVEGLLYATAKEHGITLITTSTRAQLKKYHDFQLTLGVGPDGQSWEFDRIGTERERMSTEREIRELKEKVSKVEGLRRRLEEIEGELRLGRVFVKGGGDLGGEGDGEGAGEQGRVEEEGEEEREGVNVNVEGSMIIVDKQQQQQQQQQQPQQQPTSITASTTELSTSTPAPIQTETQKSPNPSNLNMSWSWNPASLPNATSNPQSNISSEPSSPRSMGGQSGLGVEAEEDENENEADAEVGEDVEEVEDEVEEDEEDESTFSTSTSTSSSSSSSSEEGQQQGGQVV